jgi:integrase
MKVTIECDRGKLRLRWFYQGKRVNLSLGVDDNALGRAFAKEKAGQIEKDYSAGHYDATLLRYKPRLMGKNPTEVSAPELFAKWTQYVFKEKGLAVRSIEARYKPLESALKRHLDISANQVTESKARNFAAICMESLAPNTAKARLWLLQSCWDWANGKYHIAADNPWKGIAARIKAQPSRKARPFSETEIKEILASFQSSRYYSHYYSVVMFLIHTAVRPGEAFALKWRSVADDFSHVAIREAVSRGHRRDTTKTGKPRVIYLSPVIAQMLMALHCNKQPKPDDLVFPGPRGGTLDDHMFAQRAWKRVLESVGVDYRSLYCIRHSAISHALSRGANPVELSEQTGHSKAILLSTYAHAIEKRSLFVEF